MRHTLIHKLLNTHLKPPDSPVIVAELAEQPHYLQQLQQQLQQQILPDYPQIRCQSVQQNHYQNSRYHRYDLLTLTLSPPYFSSPTRSRSHYQTPNASIELQIRFAFSTEPHPHQLGLCYYYSTPYPISGDLEQLRPLLNSLMEQINQEGGQQQKQAKIRELQWQAIQGRVEELAQRWQWSYSLTEMKQQVRIGFATHDHSALIEIDVKWRTLSSAMQQIDQAVELLRQLQALGIVNQIRLNKSSVTHLSRHFTPPPQQSSTDDHP